MSDKRTKKDVVPVICLIIGWLCFIVAIVDSTRIFAASNPDFLGNNSFEVPQLNAFEAINANIVIIGDIAVGLLFFIVGNLRKINNYNAAKS